MGKTCRECGSKCCTYFCFEIDEPDTYEEFDDVRWYLNHEGVSVHIDEGDWYISIASRCKMLARDARCLIYADRPLICRKYDPAKCDFAPGDYGYEELFLTGEQLEAYARDTLGEEEYERAKRKVRAKLEPKRTGRTKKKGKRR